MRTHHVLLAGAGLLAVVIVLLIGWAIGRHEPASAATAPAPGSVADLTGSVATAEPAVVMLSAGGGEASDRLPMGSGFVISPDGYVVTAAHVVGSLPVVTAVFADGAAYRAEVVGLDREADVALFRITGAAQQALPALKWADSDGLRGGQPVAFLGAPYGLAATVTAGVISTPSRRIDSAIPFGLIQTDAALTAGGSGGPLVNARGEVVGMATARLGKGDVGSGIAFAVPANAVKAAAERLRNPPQPQG